MLGILTSMKIISGRHARAVSNASTPSEASATISIPGTLLKYQASRPRNGPQSSTTRTRRSAVGRDGGTGIRSILADID